MSAHQILTTEQRDLIPRSAGERTRLPLREDPPKNTISNAEISKLIGTKRISSDLIGKGLLKDAAMRFSKGE